MSETRELRFQLSDRVGDAEVSPAAVPLALLKQFSDEVGKFLAGSRREVDLATLPVAISSGSLMLVAPVLDDSLSLWSDLAALEREDSLHLIDPKRREIWTRWQQQSKARPSRRYAVSRPTATRALEISAQSNYRIGGEQPWVRTERYLSGRVLDMGGKTSANLHMQLEDGRSLKIDATQDQLASEKDNHLYHDVLLRVQLEENVRTGELRNARLLGFERYQPRFDSAAFDEFVRKGTEAWRDVTDPVAWVREQRGS